MQAGSPTFNPAKASISLATSPLRRLSNGLEVASLGRSEGVATPSPTSNSSDGTSDLDVGAIAHAKCDDGARYFVPKRLSGPLSQWCKHCAKHLSEHVMLEANFEAATPGTTAAASIPVPK